MNFSYARHSIGREAAIALYESGWWKGKSAREIVGVQLFLEELACPFPVFHAAIEEALGRPVYTHEFGLNYDGLVAEFCGLKPPPTLEEIMNLIPAEKRIVLLRDRGGMTCGGTAHLPVVLRIF